MSLLPEHRETSALDSGPPRSSRARLVQVFLPLVGSLSLSLLADDEA